MSVAPAESVFFVYFPVGCRLVVLSGYRNHTGTGQSLFAVLASAIVLDSLNAFRVSEGEFDVDCLLGLDCLGCCSRLVGCGKLARTRLCTSLYM